MSEDKNIISVLFADKYGCYANNQGVDLWDVERNALNFKGTAPVICHPPCQLWGSLAFVNYKRWGGDHNKPENDGGLFEFALKVVEKNGGVLEHPAKSRAWMKFGICKPERNIWKKTRKGWTCEVWQSAYGHRANKSTWLYFVGNVKPFELCWDRPRGAFQIGFQDQRGKNKNKPTLSKKEANATPEKFKNVLLELARFSRLNKIKSEGSDGEVKKAV